ncbi:hypothetical protein OAK19_00700 [Aureispira]|nr:hypothetical protein [Aureispira sp.]
MKNVMAISITIFISLLFFTSCNNNSGNSKSEVQFGSYVGFFGICDKMTSVTTKLEYNNDEISGEYSYGKITGELTNCTLNNNKLTCDWVELKNSAGKFEAIFNDNFSEFIGIWYLSENIYEGSWTGKRTN